jgi:hypothetical protein
MFFHTPFVFRARCEFALTDVPVCSWRTNRTPDRVAAGIVIGVLIATSDAVFRETFFSNLFRGSDSFTENESSSSRLG